MYEELSIPLFINQYQTIMDNVKLTPKPALIKHLNEFIVDVKLYSRKHVKAG